MLTIGIIKGLALLFGLLVYAMATTGVARMQREVERTASARKAR